MPRLLELLHAVRSIKTPTMTLEVNVLGDPSTQCKRVCQELVHTNLSEFVVSSSIHYDAATKPLYGHQALDAQGVMCYATCYGVDSKYWSTPWCIKLVLASTSTKSLPDLSLVLYQVRRQHLDCSVLGFFEPATQQYCVHVRVIDHRPPTDEVAYLRQKLKSILETYLQGDARIHAAYVRNVGSKWFIDTQGSCLAAVGQLSHDICCNTIVSNDPREVASVLGIEAARQVLLNELIHVLSFDGSYVNARHLKLLVDVMTNRGSLTPINMTGFVANNPSVMGRASFERVYHTFLNGAMRSTHDSLHGVSENVMLGNLCRLGTGTCQLRLDEDKLQNALELSPLVSDVVERPVWEAENTPLATPSSPCVVFGCTTAAEFSPINPLEYCPSAPTYQYDPEELNLNLNPDLNSPTNAVNQPTVNTTDYVPSSPPKIVSPTVEDDVQEYVPSSPIVSPTVEDVQTPPSLQTSIKSSEDAEKAAHADELVPTVPSKPSEEDLRERLHACPQIQASQPLATICGRSRPEQTNHQTIVFKF